MWKYLSNKGVIMKKPLFLLIPFFVFTSCATFKMSDLKPYPKNKNLLPALEPRVDVSSIESAFTLGTSLGATTGYANKLGKNSVLGTAITSTEISKDPRVQDAITVFDRDVKDNITNPYGDRKGYILCKIAAGENSTGIGWSFASGFFLFIPNFVGMPLAHYVTTLDVEVEIYNLSEKLIRRYNSQCQHDTWSAFYYGYGLNFNAAKRKAGLEAFKCAMNDIKKQIESDASDIIQELNK